MRPIMEPSRQLTLRALPLAIATALFIPAAPTWADGLQALTGHDSAPSIHNKDTVPIIDIVAPNAAGLSHNLYSEYNVGSKGVVLNNSLVAGHS
jgi:hemolysin